MSPNMSIYRVCLALLPALIQIKNLEISFFVGGCVCFGFWISYLFFHYAQNLFPEKLLKTAIILWFMALGQMVWYVLQLQPLWIGSLILLFYTYFFNSDETTRHRVFGAGALFWVFSVFLGASHEFLGAKTGVALFENVFGAFLWLGIFAWILSRILLFVKREGQA